MQTQISKRQRVIWNPKPEDGPKDEKNVNDTKGKKKSCKPKVLNHHTKGEYMLVERYKRFMQKKIAMWWAETKINEKSPLKRYKSVLSSSLLFQ